MKTNKNVAEIKINKKALTRFLEYVYKLERVADDYGIDKGYTDTVATVFSKLQEA